MLVRKASCGVVLSGLTERERCGANYREEMKEIMRERSFIKAPVHPKLGKKKRKVSQASAHQVHEIQREYVDTAGDGGERADDGGQDAEATRTEQKILRRERPKIS